jgi:hypothetical protein
MGSGDETAGANDGESQDLGLHRKLGSERKEQSEADHTELRRRVWGGCLIADRWIAAIVGF